jgi:hypothetical protein
MTPEEAVTQLVRIIEARDAVHGGARARWD